ncbi:MAG: SDR family oxidoreductase [Saprospiraceae bacterium]
MSANILVTGATGTIGQALVNALQARGASFKIAARDVAKAREKFGSEVSIVAFDFADSSTYAPATAGVDRVFLLGPPLSLELDTLLQPFIHYLKKHDIRRVVYLSAFGMESISDKMPFHRNIEQQLRADDFELTVLRPTFFAQNFKNYEWDNVIERKITYMPAGNGKTAFVDVQDIAEVAATVLLEDGHNGKDYVLTGSESLSYYDAAALLSEVRKENIIYPNPSPEEYAQTLQAAGAPAFIADYMNTVYGMIREGQVDHVSPHVEQLLGRKPGTLKNVLEKSFA